MDVRLISKTITITLEEEYEVRQGNVSTGAFSPTRSRVHLRILFFYIISTGMLRTDYHIGHTHAVCLQFNNPPFTYREVPTGHRDTIWTKKHGKGGEMQFVCSVDFTKNRAFNRARAIRIFLDTGDGTLIVL